MASIDDRNEKKSQDNETDLQPAKPASTYYYRQDIVANKLNSERAAIAAYENGDLSFFQYFSYDSRLVHTPKPVTCENMPDRFEKEPISATIKIIEDGGFVGKSFASIHVNNIGGFEYTSAKLNHSGGEYLMLLESISEDEIELGIQEATLPTDLTLSEQNKIAVGLKHKETAAEFSFEITLGELIAEEKTARKSKAEMSLEDRIEEDKRTPPPISHWKV